MINNECKLVLIKELGYLYPNENSKQKKKFGLYECGYCGKILRVQIYDVQSGRNKSCGCYNIGAKTHGKRYTRLYGIWLKLKDRVLNPKNKSYIDYGGRGITVCEEWKNDFMSFYNWSMENGYSDDLSLDRIDNDGNYEPNNCRWATRTIQSRNQRIYKSNTSGYKGVSYNKDNNKYIAQIKVNKLAIYLGSYLNVIEAGVAYNNYIIENNLEGFILNEIPDKSLTND